jgi:hypothetical protein
VEKLAAAEKKFSERLPPIEALRAWMLLFVDYIATKQIIYESYLWILQTLLLTHPDLHPRAVREGTVIRLLTPLSEQCQFLRCGLQAAGCPPKCAFSSSTLRRLSCFVLSSIRDPAKPAE